MLKYFAFILALTLLACNASAQPTLTSQPQQTPALVRGVAISPQGFPADYSKFADFCAEAQAMPNGGMLWNGYWQEGVEAGQIPAAASATLQCAGHATPLLVFGWRSGEALYLSVPNDTTNNWSNAATRQLYAQMVSSFAATYKPPFIFLGNENDFYYEQDAADYANWLTAYNAAYDAIKKASSNTQVGPVFNYEHLAGAGTLNGWTTVYWEALTMHDLAKVDIVGLTLYPFLAISSASAVPTGYLDPLFERIGNKPIAITETGWPAEPPSNLQVGWEANESAQVTYLSQLEAMLKGKDVRVVSWLFLYPLADTSGSSHLQLFGSISLKDEAGNKRPVYEEWLSFRP